MRGVMKKLVVPVSDARKFLPFSLKVPLLLRSISYYFNRKTLNIFRFWSDRPQVVKLEIYDTTGRLMLAPFSGAVSIGEHEVVVNAGDLPSGAYIAVLVGEGQRVIRKIALVR